MRNNTLVGPTRIKTYCGLRTDPVAEECRATVPPGQRSLPLVGDNTLHNRAGHRFMRAWILVLHVVRIDTYADKVHRKLVN